jgi:hypothetical protein
LGGQVGTLFPHFGQIGCSVPMPMEAVANNSRNNMMAKSQRVIFFISPPLGLPFELHLTLLVLVFQTGKSTNPANQSLLDL